MKTMKPQPLKPWNQLLVRSATLSGLEQDNEEDENQMILQAHGVVCTLLQDQHPHYRNWLLLSRTTEQNDCTMATLFNTITLLERTTVLPILDREQTSIYWQSVISQRRLYGYITLHRANMQRTMSLKINISRSQPPQIHKESPIALKTK